MPSYVRANPDDLCATYKKINFIPLVSSEISDYQIRCRVWLVESILDNNLEFFQTGNLRWEDNFHNNFTFRMFPGKLKEKIL